MSDEVQALKNEVQALKDSIANLLGTFNTPLVKVRLGKCWTDWHDEVCKIATDAINGMVVDQSRCKQPMERLCIVQETGMQCGISRYETHIHDFITFDDEKFGKQYCAKLNSRTDLPFYLSKVEVKLIGKMELYDNERLEKEGIEKLENTYLKDE